MAEMRKHKVEPIKQTAGENAPQANKCVKLRLEQLMTAAKSFRINDIVSLWQRRDYKLWAQGLRKWRTKLKKIARKIWRNLKKILINMARHWRFLTVFVPLFLLMYYGLGGMIVENIDVKNEYKPHTEPLLGMETAESMSFLLKRELDDKMWTPNIPIIFPAYVLDNMPNFQIGMVRAVRDIACSVKNFKSDAVNQSENIKAACKYLNYSPRIWIMSRKSKFNLAPSANTQYRKAAAELHKFAKNGVFKPQAMDLDIVLQKINKALHGIVARNETQQQENSAEWLDFNSDNLFYYGKGYAFALWQIGKVLGTDFKETILADDIYTEWTYFVNSLKKAAELKPFRVRNGRPESMWSPNHLIMQNYYLQRAMIAVEKIHNRLEKNAN